MTLPVPSLPAASSARALRLGFLALTDAAPLVVAQERGLFRRHGLKVVLQREVGWATIRDKIIYGELEAAQALAPMLWSVNLGLGCVPTAASTAFIFNLNGNALTLSNALHDAGVRDAASLRDIARGRRGERRLTLGVVYPFSSHHLHLRQWLAAAGIQPDADVRIVVVPPAQMFRNLQAGTIDGFWAGEPWNSFAVRAGIAWCPTWSGVQSPAHIEKVLLITERFASERAGEHAALVNALDEAARWCDVPENRPELAQLLSAAPYLNLPARVISPALTGVFDCGRGRVESVPDFVIFHRDRANRPTADKALAIQRELADANLLPAETPAGLPARLFREDRYDAALSLSEHHDFLPSPTVPQVA